ncbi:TniQ family protein [Paraburkholderia xenovorans]|uniref:TniQ family protein n=1 Tax=Paraburkholderia xenovorans TaxID=36873 RepID=UPI0038BAC988
MAIALLPLLDGETLGSNLGRYAESIGAESTLRLRRRVFGYPCKPDTRLPSGINHLAEQTRDYWGLTPEQILKRGTEFYYATATMSVKQRESMFSALLEQPGSRTFRRSVGGWSAERVAKFRYCEDCLAQWRDSGTPAHWMVDHQLPGVYLCPAHSRMLKVAKRGNPQNLTDSTVIALKDVDDEDVLTRTWPSERAAFSEVAKLSALCRIASDSVPSTVTYRELLRTAGYEWPTGGVDIRTFTASMVEHFGHEYCQSTGLSLQRLAIWLKSIERDVKGGESSHPFMFISVSSMLNARCMAPGTFEPAMRNKAEEIAEVPAKNVHDGSCQSKRGWQCKGLLHRTSDAWQRDLVDFEGRLLVCSCGVTYKSSGIGHHVETDSSVMIYGERYRNLVAMRFADNFNSDSREPRFPSVNPRFARWARLCGFSVKRTISPEEILRLRDQWRSIVMKSRPQSQIMSSHVADSRLYRKLYRYDRHWIVEFNRKNSLINSGKKSS